MPNKWFKISRFLRLHWHATISSQATNIEGAWIVVWQISFHSKKSSPTSYVTAWVSRSVVTIVAYPTVLFMHLSTSHFWALVWAVGSEYESKVPERDAFGKFANITPWISACIYEVCSPQKQMSLPSHIAPEMRNICSLSPIFWSIKWYYNEFFNILFVPALIEILRFQQSNNFLFILWSNGKKIWGLHLEVPLGNLLSPTQNPCLHIHTHISPLAFLALWNYWLSSELFF